MPFDYETKSGEKLGKWINTTRTAYKNGDLSPDQIKKLEAIDMVWDAQEYVWNKWYNLAVEYRNEHGDLLVPRKYVTSSGKKLGQWMNRARQAYKNGDLSPDKIEKLNAIGMVWDASINKEETWNKWYQLAVEYRNEHGDLLAPALYKTKSGEKLGFWISGCRKDYQKGNLSPDKIEKLEAIDMVWNVREYEWNKMYKLAEEYYNEHGDLLVSKDYKTKSGENLGTWISRARQAYKKGDLSPDQIKKLEVIGMGWDIKANKNDIEDYLEGLKTSEPPIIIDKKINKEVLSHVSLLELQSKIRFLTRNRISPVDSSGKLIDIFSMSSLDIEEKYSISLEIIINTYGKGVARK